MPLYPRLGAGFGHRAQKRIEPKYYRHFFWRQKC
jgi:hypothetical protein